MKYKDVTEKYIQMLESFEADYYLLLNEKEKFLLLFLNFYINFDNNKLFSDIKLLEELSFNLRHKKMKIVLENKEEK